MWKCLCRNIQRSVANACPRCGRTFSDIASYRSRLEKIEVALSIVAGSGEEIRAVENLVFACLAENMPLSNITAQLKSANTSVAMRVARVLQNLVG